MQPDWWALYTKGAIKFHWVPRTEEESKLVYKEDNSVDWVKVKELRSGFIKKNSETIADPKNEAVKQEKKKTQLEKLLDKYEEKYGKRPVWQWAKNKKWILSKLEG